jgi:OmpA-OmpF porin, OOP family
MTLFILSQTGLAQSTDFVQGTKLIFEDNFSQDPEGDFPAKWSTSGSGEVVTLEGLDGKWLRIMQPTAVSPELKKALPENCTIEFDLYLKSTTGVAPLIMFGLTPLSDVAAGQVFRQHISVKLYGYNKTQGSVIYAKNIQELGKTSYGLQGYVNRVLHVSISINKSRWRVYLDQQKVVDLPKLITPEFRNNFFIASAVISPSPQEGVYISNVRIAEGDVDARSLLIKQLLEQGSAITSDIQFTAENELTAASQPIVDQLGQALGQDPDLNIQINGVEETTANNDAGTSEQPGTVKEALKTKAEKIKAYLVEKFRIESSRILADAKQKALSSAEQTKMPGKVKGFITEIIKR